MTAAETETRTKSETGWTLIVMMMILAFAFLTGMTMQFADTRDRRRHEINGFKVHTTERALQVEAWVAKFPGEPMTMAEWLDRGGFTGDSNVRTLGSSVVWGSSAPITSAGTFTATVDGDGK